MEKTKVKKKIIEPKEIKKVYGKPNPDLEVSGVSMNELGLEQEIESLDGRKIKLHEVITKNDFWQSEGRVKRTILTHDGIKKIADIAGVRKDPEYTILTQPDVYNNYQYTIQVKICRGDVCVTEIGESNRNNLGGKGRGNPANMAQKRAYDRAVLRLLGITGLLSEEELSDSNENEETKMDGLTHEEKKVIAPLINDLMLAKTKEHLAFFNAKMKETAKTLQSNQLDYLRKLYQKRFAELSKVSF